MNFPALLSFFCGFSSLSLEILWFRTYSFANNSHPSSLGFVLMAYLLGIAFGAYAGSRFCRKNMPDLYLWGASAVALFVSGVGAVVLPRLYAWMLGEGTNDPLSAIAVIASCSAVLAFVFPIAHHLGANQNNGRGQGGRFAAVYVANVFGGALGPLVTGYIILDVLTLESGFLFLAALQVLVAALFFMLLFKGGYRYFGAALGSLFVGGILFSEQKLHGYIAVLDGRPDEPEYVVENRQGVIALYSDQKGEGDYEVYGGNVYDGRTNTDVEINTNGLHRPLLLAALQPEPGRVLMIGLSIGTWLALVKEFPGVKEIDVVEINPGYVKAARNFSAQAKALSDPRVNLVVDDARRWLRVNKENKYDLIVMNTTWHWRANASMLLSREFLSLISNHLAPEGVAAFNTTSSGDAFYTAASVFPHAYKYSNFVYLAGFDFRDRKSSVESYERLVGMTMDGRPMFRQGSGTLERFLSQEFITIEQAQRRFSRPFEIITDDNMLTEFKYGKNLYWGF